MPTFKPNISWLNTTQNCSSALFWQRRHDLKSNACVSWCKNIQVKSKSIRLIIICDQNSELLFHSNFESWFDEPRLDIRMILAWSLQFNECTNHWGTNTQQFNSHHHYKVILLCVLFTVLEGFISVQEKKKILLEGEEYWLKKILDLFSSISKNRRKNRYPRSKGQRWILELQKKKMKDCNKSHWIFFRRKLSSTPPHISTLVFLIRYSIGKKQVKIDGNSSLKSNIESI